ncbi:hypothetical protein [Lentzea cavernae]|uniref:hypothetical protein n=1 Tax=Lentzea cavernae TaxID=2020703 RepID=UPI00174B9BBE|nr:hypothetical protein [Lentzea cavernae]
MIAQEQRNSSLTISGDARSLAEALDDMWLGAGVLARICREHGQMDTMVATRRLLGL